jgi:hypothetical protein
VRSGRRETGKFGTGSFAASAALVSAAELVSELASLRGACASGVCSDTRGWQLCASSVWTVRLRFLRRAPDVNMTRQPTVVKECRTLNPILTSSILTGRGAGGHHPRRRG